MNVSWLTLRDLEYVVAVAKHEHFGRASKECRVSQPSLSTQIKKIEGYLGVILFERNNRHVSTTTAGRKMAEQAAIILDEAGKIPNILGELATSEMKTLNLGVISSASSLIPHILTDLKKAFREVPLSLREGTTEDLVKELKHGALDAVIAADTVKDKTLRSIPLFFEPFVLAAPKGHPILGKSVLQTSDFRVSEMVLLEDGHCLRDQAIFVCPKSRRGNPRSFHATSIETLRHLVASGAGYTLLPKLATAGKPMSHLISYVDFKKTKIGRSIVLLCREKAANQSLIELLSRTLAKAIPDQVEISGQE